MNKRPYCIDCQSMADLTCIQAGHYTSTNYEREGETITCFDHNGAKIIRFRELSAKDEGLNRIVKCKIIAVKEIRTYNIKEVWVCPKCYREYDRYADEFKEVNHANLFCDDCGIKLYNDRSQNVTCDVRECLLQEFFEEAAEDKDGNIMPRSIEAEVSGNLVNKVFPGQDKIVEGIFRSHKDKRHNKIIFDVKRIRDIEEKVDLNVTEMDKAYFESIDDEKIVTSFAPEIWGMKNEKMGLLLGIIGGVEQEGVRSLINVFLVGDPSQAKTRLLSYAKSVVRKSAKVSGKMSSAAGLVAGIDERDGNRYPVIGPVGLCHNGLVCIDEGDKMNESDRAGLHDVMEEGVIRLNKIGVNMTIPAKTTIFMAANPRRSKYDPEATIKENINVPESLMARFALIFCCRDNLLRDDEDKKIRHVARVRKKGIDKLIEEENLLPRNMMMKFISYCKSFKPELTDEAIELANKYYLELKYIDQGKKDTIPIDVRTNEDILRLSQAAAKFKRSDKVLPEHVEIAWSMVRASLESFDMRTTGELHQSQLASNDLNKTDFFQKCIKDCASNGLVRYNDLIMHMLEEPRYFKNRAHADREFERMRMQFGLLESGTPGVYTWKE